MSAPRVLVLGAVLGQPMGGVRRHNAELLPRAAALLRERGGSLAVLEGRERIAFPLDGPIERLASDVPARPAWLRWRAEGRAARRALAAASAAGRAFDVVHTAHLPAPGRLPCPFTITIHDLRRLDALHAGRGRRATAGLVLSSAVRRAAATIAVSESVRRGLLARAPVDPERIRVVPNAADHFEPLPREPGAGAELLSVGHLEPRKNLDLVLRALASDPGLPRLVLAGAAKGGEGERLREVARALGVQDRVRFLGPFDEHELPRLYARAACVVLASRIEGFGIPALEAQRAGAPLAIARTPALVEVSGEDTPAFDPADPAGCARAIRAALGSSREALERARSRASRFSWQASARALVEAWTAAASATTPRTRERTPPPTEPSGSRSP